MCCIQDLSEVQQQVMGLGRQYDQIGDCLGSRHKDLRLILEGVTEVHNDYQSIVGWLHDVELRVSERDIDPDQFSKLDQVCFFSFFFFLQRSQMKAVICCYTIELIIDVATSGVLI